MDTVSQRRHIIITSEESSESFATAHMTGTLFALACQRKEEDIPFPLMIALVMIMRHILVERMLEAGGAAL